MVPGLGQVTVPPLLSDLQKELERSIVTPAERIAQYSLLGGVGAAAIAAIVVLSMRRKPIAPLPMLLLLSAPLTGSGIGIWFAAKGPKS